MPYERPEWDEVVAKMSSPPVAYSKGDKHWDWFLHKADGTIVGYDGPRPELPYVSSDPERCEHVITEPHVARFTGTPSRRCLNCGTYLIEFPEEEE